MEKFGKISVPVVQRKALFLLSVMSMLLVFFGSSCGGGAASSSPLGVECESGDVCEAKEVNVTDYLAVPNDELDDTAAFQQAVDTVGRNGGGVVNISAGTYIVSRLKIWPYSNVAIRGAGIGVTVLKTPGGVTPSFSGSEYKSDKYSGISQNDYRRVYNTIELCPAGVTDGVYFGLRNSVSDLTLDGNKNNVNRPSGGGANDNSHSGIYSNGSRYLNISSVEAKNYWYGGITLGMYNQYGMITNIITQNNGYDVSTGYGGLLLQASSFYNTVANHLSIGDVIGEWVVNNVQNNKLDLVAVGSLNHAIVFGSTAATNSNFGNDITVVSHNDVGGAVWVVGTSHGNRIKATVDGSKANPAVYIGALAQDNSYDLVVAKGDYAGIAIHGSDSVFDILATSNSQHKCGDNYAVNLLGASRNTIRIRANEQAFDVEALTSQGTKATAKTYEKHGITVGQTVVVTGAVPAVYNGTYIATEVGEKIFSYTFTGGTSPATGSIRAAGQFQRFIATDPQSSNNIIYGCHDGTLSTTSDNGSGNVFVGCGSP